MLNKLPHLNKKWKILLVIVMTVIAYNIYVSSYFRFENFKTNDQLIKYLNTNFPQKSNPEDALILLRTAGAQCKLSGKPFHYSEPKNAEKAWNCEYLHWELSFDLRIRFSISIYVDKKDKLIGFSAGRYPEII